MTERLERMMRAFHDAREQSDPAARDRILIEACTREDGGIDQDMLAELRAMVATEVPADFLEPEPTPEPPPRLGEFELKYVLAQGGCGVVWVARQASLDRDVAVKVLPAGPGTTAAQIERFHREPLAASSLNHPHIVSVFAEGRADDTHWFAMQLVDGHSLAREIELQRARKVADPQPLLPRFGNGQWFAAVARICADAADALHLAHEHGIVHRDVKPQNLLLDRGGNVLVADFGIARDERFGSLTETGTIAGSWHYMSPEQARIEKDPVDHRTDVYSLGVVLYELLTLSRPYEGATSQEVIDEIRRAPPRPVCRRNRQVPRDLETICMAAIARCPGNRYATAAELRDDLLRFLDHQAITRQPPSWPVRVQQWLHRRRRPLTVAATVVLVTIVSLLVQGSVYVAAERSKLVQRCDALLRAGNLDAIPPGEMSALLRDVRAASADAEPAVRAAEATLVTYRDGLVTRWRNGLVTASQLPDLSARFEALLDAFKLGVRAGTLDPAAAMPAEFDENPFLAAVEIRVTDELGRAVPATIGLSYLAATTGLPTDEVPLGVAPIARRRLRDGMYRIVVRSDQYGRWEFTRVFPFAERTTVDLQLRALDDPTAGMIRIPGGTLQIGATEMAPHGLSGHPVEIPEFWIDRCEVTVGEFRRFLRATGRTPPKNFDRIQASHDHRPVTWVTWSDARDYADWTGKRLPSLAEWMLAARGPGPDPSLLPWPRPGYFGNCRAPVDFTTGYRSDETSRFDAWSNHTTDVDASPESCTPEGVFELFGNVEEWTESLGVNAGLGRLIGQIDHRMVAGHAWFELAQSPDSNLTITTNADEGLGHYSFCRGFRCARSTTK